VTLVALATKKIGALPNDLPISEDPPMAGFVAETATIAVSAVESGRFSGGRAASPLSAG